MTDNLKLFKMLDDAYNARDWNLYDALFDEGFRSSVQGQVKPQGKAEHVRGAKEFCAMSGDNKVHNDPYVVALSTGEWTCTIARLTGTMTGPLAPANGKPIEATHRTFDTTFATIARWVDGRIVEEYEFLDTPAIMRQLIGGDAVKGKGASMNTKVIESERTALDQNVTRQPDGPGLRIGKKGEISGIGKLTPDGARVFRERLPQIQAEAGYWEKRVGTVQDFRIMLIDNDTRILFTIVFDGDFKPYIEDILREAAPWLDQIFVGVWEGFKGTKDRESVEKLLGCAFQAEFFYAANPDVTVRDVVKMQRLSTAVSELLDAAA